MRVLHLRNLGGHAALIARELRRFGVESEVWTFGGREAFGLGDKYSEVKDFYSSRGLFLRNLYANRIRRITLRPIDYLKWFRKKAKKFDTVHIHSVCAPLQGLGYLIYRLVGRKVVLLYYGSDLRMTGYNDVRILFANRLSKVFVLNPDLLRFCPATSKWMPYAVDATLFEPFKSPLEDTLHDGFDYAILHLPTNPLFKGTSYFVSAVNELKEEGYSINFITDTHIMHDEMPKYINAVDITLDQLIIGFYGTFAVESSLCGKPTVCRLDRLTLDVVGKVPIVDVTFQNLTKRLRMLLEDRGLRKKISDKAREWAVKTHSSDLVAKRWMEVYCGG